MASFIPKLFLILSLILSIKTSCALHNSSSTTTTTTLDPKSLSSIRSICKTTPYPETCFDALKLSISITIGPDILDLLLKSLEAAISEASKVSALLATAGQRNNLVEKQRGAIDDCRDLHAITLNSLRRSLSRVKEPNSAREIADAKAYLSAALTNKDTCLEGLGSASGPLKPTLVSSIADAYKHVSNSLSMLAKPGAITRGPNNRRRLLGSGRFPGWLSRKSRRILESSGDDYDPSEVITVAQDGSGNFTALADAVNFAPNNSFDRVIIYVKQGVYEENVEIPSYKTNIVLLGDGSDVTFITGSRSVGGGWTTFRSATLAVSGEGFLARDITVENTAGPENHQAVAIRVNADFAALYHCTVNGDQDSLYAHSFRQFYRECEIYGTVDFIFGNAAAVFQNCDVVSKLPMAGQFTVVTAQSRETPDEVTGMSFQNCSVLATEELFAAAGKVKSFLGRPWREFSRTVFLESYVDRFIDPAGWAPWAGDQGLDTLYYGEYDNYGPGSGTDKRVGWPGFHVMDFDDASNFTVSEFITGYAWLESTSFPYDDGI